jgi:hypothetical protein
MDSKEENASTDDISPDFWPGFARERNLAIGWDLVGWGGKASSGAQTFALLEWDEAGNWEWIGIWRRKLGPKSGLLPLVFPWEEEENQKAFTNLSSYNKVILGIDAPLGYPLAFQQQVEGGALPPEWPKARQYDLLRNRVAERYIGRKRFRYQPPSNPQANPQRLRPLSPSLDGFTHITSLALAHLRSWQLKHGFALDPQELPAPSASRVAIEVYPAWMKVVGQPYNSLSPGNVLNHQNSQKQQKAPVWQAYARALQELDGVLEEAGPGHAKALSVEATFHKLYAEGHAKGKLELEDACDAALCALMAMGYGFRQNTSEASVKRAESLDSPGFPLTTTWRDIPRSLRHYARHEGWIHHPMLG